MREFSKQRVSPSTRVLHHFGWWGFWRPWRDEKLGRIGCDVSRTSNHHRCSRRKKVNVLERDLEDLEELRRWWRQQRSRRTGRCWSWWGSCLRPRALTTRSMPERISSPIAKRRILLPFDRSCCALTTTPAGSSKRFVWISWTFNRL